MTSDEQGSQKQSTLVMCKGSWRLGTACGQCQRCHDTILDAKDAIRELMSRRDLTPTRDEWQERRNV